MTINGPASITTAQGGADYTISNDPGWASGFKDVSVSCDDTRVTVSNVTKRSFHVAISGFDASADIILNLSATGNNGTTITATKTVNVVWIFTGVGIISHEGTIYTKSEWQAGSFPSSAAFAVVVSDGTNEIFLSNSTTAAEWCAPATSVLPGCKQTTFESEANVDFAGAENTDAIIAAKTAGTITECPAATWCRDLGASWYLPAGGEMLMITNNVTDVDACRDLLGLTKISTLSYIWTSTQYDESNAWYFYRDDSSLDFNRKPNLSDVVAVSKRVYSGVGIQHTDGTIYTRAEWEAHTEFTADDARGIAVGNGVHSLCLHKNCANSKAWSEDTSTLIDVGGLPYTTESTILSKTDFGGKANTDAIFKYKESQTYSAPAFEYARSIGEEYYLPAAGELRMICINKDEISACSDVIGGNLRSMFEAESYRPWASTQISDSRAHRWSSNTGTITGQNKHNTNHALSCVAL